MSVLSEEKFPHEEVSLPPQEATVSFVEDPDLERR
jgi:hypothetical protein